MYTSLTHSEQKIVLDIINKHKQEHNIKIEIQKNIEVGKISLDSLYYSFLPLETEIKYLFETRNKNHDIDFDNIRREINCLKSLLTYVIELYLKNIKEYRKLYKSDKDNNIFLDSIIHHMYRENEYRNKMERLYSVTSESREKYTNEIIIMGKKLKKIKSGIKYFEKELCYLETMMRNMDHLENRLIQE